MGRKIIGIFVVMLLIASGIVSANMKNADDDTACMGDMEILIDDIGTLRINDKDIHDCSAKWTKAGGEIIGYVSINVTFYKGSPIALFPFCLLGGQIWLNYGLLRYQIGPGTFGVMLKDKEDRYTYQKIEFQVPFNYLSDEEKNNKEFELKAAVRGFGILGIRIFRPKFSQQTQDVTITITYDWSIHQDWKINWIQS